jgi:hypothetical protein
MARAVALIFVAAYNLFSSTTASGRTINSTDLISQGSKFVMTSDLREPRRMSAGAFNLGFQ